MEETNQERNAACYRFELGLQAYMEGEHTPFISGHARECTSCRMIIEDLEALRAAAREIPLEEPSPAVWSNIRARLAEEGVFAREASLWTWFRQLDFLRRPVPVVGFACLIIVGCFVTVPNSYLEQRTNAGFDALHEKTTVRSTALAGDSAALEHAVHELEDTFRAREASLAPDLKTTYDNSLNSLDVSIQECSDSLRVEPDNSLAHDYLLKAYSQKAEVLSAALEFDEGR